MMVVAIFFSNLEPAVQLSSKFEIFLFRFLLQFINKLHFIATTKKIFLGLLLLGLAISFLIFI
jgi:hypothetical protein